MRVVEVPPWLGRSVRTPRSGTGKERTDSASAAEPATHHSERVSHAFAAHFELLFPSLRKEGCVWGQTAM